jgi:hypothetical protein
MFNRFPAQTDLTKLEEHETTVLGIGLVGLPGYVRRRRQGV